MFTNNRGCDLIKKKTGIIKPEGEIVKERLFITPEYTTAKEIKKIRKELHLTQKEFAEFINCSKPTVERWERSEDVIRGPIVPFLKMLQKYPEYEQEVKVPEKVWPLRIWYMYDQDVCTLIDVNERERKVKIKNYTDKIMFRAFGVMEEPDYNQYIETHTPNEELLHAMQQTYFLNLVSELFDFSPIARSFNEQARLIDEHFYKLFPQLLAEYKKQIQIFTTEIVDVSYRFHKQYERLVTQSTDYNTNNDLQIRIIKGAAYFEQKLRPFHKLAEATNLPTDNKELRKKTNNTLEEFLNTLTQKLSLLQYVEDNGFHASDYLRKKAYILLSETDNKNSSGTTAHDRKERTPRERVSRERKRIEVPNDILHPELYRKITEWRGTKAKETGMPAYVIIQQKALLGMVNLLPNDAESLEAVPYFGRKGVENYGLELLGIIRNYMKEQNLQRPEIRTVFVPRENKKK